MLALSSSPPPRTSMRNDVIHLVAEHRNFGTTAASSRPPARMRTRQKESKRSKAARGIDGPVEMR
eukprot:2343467-Rhodomonas_salina.2